MFPRRRWSRGLPAPVLIGAVLLLASCGSAPQAAVPSGQVSPPEPAPVRVAVLLGSQYFPMKVLLDQHFDRKHGIQVTVTKVANPAAITTALQTGAVDIAFHGLNEVVNNRAAGGDWRALAPMSGFEAEDVLVPADSAIHSFADLKGKKIGSFGGPETGAGALLRVLLKKFHGFDPMADGDMVSAAAPLVAGMLEQGKVAAAYLNDPFVSRLLATGRYRSLGNVGAAWRERTGQEPLLVVMVSTDAFLKAHGREARAFMAAFHDSVAYLDSHTEIWPDLASGVDVTDPRGVDLLRTRLSGSYRDHWTADLVKAQRDYEVVLHGELGQGIVPGTFPEDAIWTDRSR